MRKIENVIILNGPGRSGTTLIYQILAKHEDLAWISGWVNRRPNWPVLSVFNRSYSPNWILKNSHKIKRLPKPAEAYTFWKYFYNVSNNSILESTIVKNQKVVISKLISIIKYSKGNRLIIKVTGDSREKLFNSLFNSFQLVWIERDPRVVVSSYMKLKWDYRNRSQDFSKLTEKEKIKYYCDRYIKTRSDFSNQKNAIVVRYEDLIQNPTQFFRRLCSHLNLDYSEKFAKIVTNWPLKEVGWDTYKNNYSEEGINFLEKSLKNEMSKLGYTTE